MTIGDRDAVCDAIIADTLHLFADADEDDSFEIAMRTSWLALCTKLRAAPLAPVPFNAVAALRWWTALQRADALVAHRLALWCRAARMFLSLPAGGAPSESACSSTSDTLTKKRMSLADDTGINELATTLAAKADAAAAAEAAASSADEDD